MTVKHVEHYCDLYNCRLLVAWGGSTSQLGKFLLDRFGVTFDDLHGLAGYAWVVPDDDGYDVFGVWIADKYDFISLSHEVLHMVLQIFKSRGIAIDHDNAEPLTYYHEQWFSKFWKSINPRKRVKNGDCGK